MIEAQLKRRMKSPALDAIGRVDSLPKERVTERMARQALRSATSFAANYRAACSGRIDDERAAKLGIVEKEADKSPLWLELLTETGWARSEQTQPLIREADEILYTAVDSTKTLRSRRSPSRVREGVSDYDVAPWDENEFAVPQSTIHNP